MSTVFENIVNNEMVKSPIESCWVCDNPNCSLSKCPQSWGMHKDPPSYKWDQAKKYMSIYFPNQITANLCFDCAH